ncbi:MAG: methyltransferase domain-containing protein [Clostridia bacterium]|jgi:cyclopropane fatty-acyl-phospholipid synthase-like methyltransferase|nr:methyltransferase domain-containing protein [Clostridia bacterium]MCI2000577.1 methyltransferase domain-containing protein [Clostridia bacterium]MCI2015033.1 methyltransferase domain-containing protein [Clostridia bacterium]
MANNDRVYESYIGSLGEDSKVKTEKRIKWIIKNLGTDKRVLDIGCSQGIVSIFAAKSGNKVVGIDIQPEAIDFAQKLINEKYAYLKDSIEFLCLDFLEYTAEKKFDAIIMTEVLEHLEHPSEFLKHSKELLNDNGILICSVPFGVMDHPDHKSTFYLTGIVDIIEKSFSIERIDYMNKWIGFIAKNSSNIDKIIYDHDVVLNLENNFFKIDRDINNRLKELYLKNTEFAQKYRESVKNYEALKQKNELSQKNCTVTKEKLLNENEKVKKLTTDKEKLIADKEKLTTDKEKLIADKEKLTTDKEKLTIDKEKLTDMLIDIYQEINKGIQIFNENKAVIRKLESQNNYLKHENAEYKRKLSMITDTLIGKIGVKGYRVLKKIKAKLG